MSRERITLIAVVLLFGAGVAPAAAPDPDVGWWKFDDGAGDMTADSTANGYDGTILDGTWVEGGWNGMGWCLDFDGNDDRVELGVIDVEGAGITLAAWVQPDDFDIGDGRIVSKANEWHENSHWWMLSTISGPSIRMRLKTTDGQNTTTLIADSPTLEIGEWQHAAATWDGQTMRVWHNAAEVGSSAKGGDAVATDPSVKAAIGSQPIGAYDTDPLHGNKFFDGRLDEVRIYSYALSQAELAELIKGLHPTAWKPDPADGAVGVVQPLLMWEPSDTGLLHNVYLGTRPELGPDDLVASNHGMAMYWHVPGLDPGVTYYWRIDDIEVGGTVITGKVWRFTTATVMASQPQPGDGAKWIDPADATLSWLAGKDAITHDVYFGTNASDVAGGSGDTFMLNQPGTSFDPGPLEEDTTYYWRIDEVGVAGSKQTGEVWSFTTQGPGGGIKGEYFSNPDLSGEPAMVRIDPGINFQWGTNGPGAPLPGTGYSVRWTGELEAAFTERYTISTRTNDGVKFYFDGRLVVDKWFGHTDITRYSVEVDLVAGQTYPMVMEFYYDAGAGAVAELSWQSAHTPEQIVPAGALSPLLRAHSPNPPRDAVDVRQTSMLSWRAGENAAQHDVYFGDDAEAVANATTAHVAHRGRQALDEVTYDPGVLEWNKMYYWRIDEVNAAHPDSPWPGDVWSFTTADFIVVDDFETYTDNIEAGETIYQTWVDGLENNNGSVVGYMEAREGTFGERQTVHGGRQSMPLEYDNAGMPFYSEAERTWATPQDWTINGVDTLVLHVKGKADNGPDILYVALEDSAGHIAVVAHPDAQLPTLTTWRQWETPLADFSGVNVTAVKKMYLGLGDRNAPTAGGAGLIFIDDIWVIKSAPAVP